MRRALLGIVGAVLGVAAALIPGIALAPPAAAACHAFEVAVSPATPAEGTAVDVTVSRDAAVNPSSVRVRTVDGTARAGEDYEAVDRRVEFTTEVEQTFTLQILDDPADEPAEDFRITLSEAGGCPVNPNFSYGEASVSIQDDDEPPATTQPPATQPAPTSTAATTATTTTETTETTAPDATSTTASTAAVPPTLPGEEGLEDETPTTTDDLDTDELAADAGGDDDDGDGALAAVLIVLALAAVAGAGFAVYRFRSARIG